MKKFTITILFSVIQIIAFGQEKLVKDIDNDGVKDVVCVGPEELTIDCKLSTKKFKRISSEPIEILNLPSGFKKTKNGFEFFNNWMRAGYKCQFRYNSKTKKIQLIGISLYEFGNAANDGSGEGSINLITGDYIGDWNYWDSKKNELIKIPTIKTKMKTKAVNLEDFSDAIYFSYSLKSADLYYKYKKIKMEQE